MPKAVKPKSQTESADSIESYLTVSEAAPLIKNIRTGKRGVTRQRLLALIRDERIAAVKKGRDWFVKRSDALAFEPLPAHRPEVKKDETA